jgi:hypothetical protein
MIAAAFVGDHLKVAACVQIHECQLDGVARDLTLKRDEIWMNRHRALGHCLSMILSENRFTLFRNML